MKKLITRLLSIFLFVALSINAKAQFITTVAGTGSSGYSGDGGPATAATMYGPLRVTLDGTGNLYIVDDWDRVRKVDPSGIISTFAGDGSFTTYGPGMGDGGPATNASIYAAHGITIGRGGDIYIGSGYNRVRRVNSSGIITTFAGGLYTGTTVTTSGDGGPATAAGFAGSCHIIFDAAGNGYLTDGYSGRVRKINLADTISTFAGTTPGFSGDGGPATAAQLGTILHDLAFDGAGNLYIADASNSRIRKVDAMGIITTVAGSGIPGYSGDGGPATAANISVVGLAIDGTGNIYLSSGTGSGGAHHRVRKINTAGIITTVAGDGTGGYSGDGGPATAARLWTPVGLAVDSAGNVYIAEQHRRVRKITVNNHPVFFTGGASQSITVCENGINNSINSVLSIIDSDVSQSETWSVALPAAHGSIVGTCASFSSGATVVPTGLFYTPTMGYSGNDSFKMRISDGFLSDTITIYVTIVPLDLAIVGARHACEGLATVLSDTVTGGVWSSDNVTIATIGSATGIVTGVAAGTATISYSLSLSCGSAVSLATVTINPSPSPIGGAASLCPGSTVALTNATVGGAWSSSSPSLATVGTFTGLVSGVSAGTPTITYTLPAGCMSTQTLTVYPLPAIISGYTNVCIGSAITLSDATSGGAWGSPAFSSFVSVGSTTGVVTGLSVGTAIISYTLPTGCARTIMVNVITAPLPIVGDTSVCTGSTTPLYDGTPGGSWISGVPSVATVHPITGVVTGITPGTTLVSYTFGSGCTSFTTVTVSASPPPIIGVPNVCIGVPITLSDPVPGGIWTSSDYTTAYVDASTGDVTGFAHGSATITYTLTGGCYATAAVTVNPAPVAITGAGSTCVGATTNLYNSISGGTWTCSNTAVATINSAGVYTGVAAGSATISYSTGAGCTVTFPIVVYAVPAPITGTLNVCVAATTTLSSTSGGGMWSAAGGATVGPTGIVTGVSAGIAQISYTLSSGCRTTATVTVNALPSAITGTMTVCPAGTTALGGSPGSGTWLSSSTAFATIGSGTGIASGVATGTSVITYTLPTGCSMTRTLTVNPLPAAITGATGICVGISAVLSVTTGGGTWTRSNTNIAIGSASGLVTGVNAGTAIVTYTLPTGCYVTKAMTINSSPGTITGTMQVCAGGSAGLTVTSGGGTWSSGAPATATIGSSTGIVSGVAAGTAGITYSVGTGCSATATVTVHALPAAFTVTGGGGYCAGGAGLHVGLSGSVTGVNYQLYMGASAVGSPVAGTGGALDFGFQVAMGTYTVVATNAQGCTAPMTGSVAITINPLPAPISGPSAVCVGAGIALTNSGGGTWVSSAPGTATINSTSGIVTGVAIGTTTITYTLPTTCAVTKIITVSSSPSAIVGPVTVCAGGTATLTVSPGGGLWSSSAGVVIGSLSGVVTGVTTGPATVTYSLGTGCTVTKTMTVLASPAAITGSMQVCAGSMSALSVGAGSGGVWTSGSTGVATVGSSGVVSGVSAGTAEISYTAGGCSSTATVTVNAVPGSITGAGTVCAGATSPALSVTPGGGTWSTTATTLHIGSADGIVTGVSAGTGVVTYSLGAGMTACSVTRTITVNAAPAISGASGVCVSATSAWSVGAGSGLWSSGATGIATVSSGGLVTGVSAGAAAITFTPASGCIAIKTVTVNTTPGAITGTAQVCVGGSTPLSVASGSGGVWTSGSVGVASVGSLSGIVNGIGAGVSTITYSLGSGCTVTKVVTVNALPPAIIGGATICIGSTTVLSNPIPGGAWSSGAAGIASVSAMGLVTGVAMGTAAISYTLPTGCAVTKDVTVNSLPGSISGANQVCAGGSSTGLTVTGSGGVWSSSNVLIAGVGSGTGVVTGIVAGTATITYSLGPGCEVTKQMTVHALPAGITGSSSICIGSSATLTTSSSGGTWSSGSTGVATVGASSGIVTGVAGGSATVSYTVASTGCAATYGVTVITVPPITGLTNLCAWGDTVTIYNSNPAGSYSSSLVTVANLGGGMGRLTTFAPGTGSVTYTLAGVGCALTMQVTVNTLPGLITGTMNLCAGSSSTLGNAVGGGVWSSGAVGVATIGSTSGLLTGVGAGSTYIRYTIPNGCKVDTVANVSTFPVAGSIAGVAGLCVGDMSALTVGAGSGGVWTSGAAGVAGVSVSGMVTGVSAGVAVISYVVTNVCGTATATHALTVNPIPDAGVISGVDSVCVGSSSAGLTVTIGGGVWSYTNGNATVSSAGVVSGVTVGMDTVVYTVTSAEGCVGSTQFVVKVKPWGLCGALETSPRPSPGERVSVRVWPNPAKDELYVENAMGSEVRIYNMLGQEVIAASLVSKKEVLNISSLVPGIYVVEVVGDFGKVSRRLVVGR